jgi:ubiquinone/menaquinone biosynthesis C-methylase UbiE
LVGEDVLEVGFGTGDLLIDLAESGYSPYGLDSSIRMVRIAMRKLRRKGLSVPLCRGYAQALPFANESFDSIASTFPSSFIFEPASLAEMKRVLRQGGRLVVVREARLVGHSLLSRFVKWLYLITGQYRSEVSLEKSLTSAGLAVRKECEVDSLSMVQIIVAKKS